MNVCRACGSKLDAIVLSHVVVEWPHSQRLMPVLEYMRFEATDLKHTHVRWASQLEVAHHARMRREAMQ